MNIFKKINFKYKKELLYIILTLLLFILSCELTLRLFNFTYYPLDIGFKITPEYKIFEQVGNNYRTKKAKSRIFFAQTFPVNKNPSEIRIFVLGGSSIFNLENFSYLSDKLIKKFPDKNIRIINIGGQSYGTTRLLLHTQEILEYQPDLIILYSGHNEFCEEYFEKNFFQDTFFTRLNNRLIDSSKLYQFISMLINNLINSLFTSNEKALKEGKQPFFPPSTLVDWNIRFEKETTYNNYKNNIIKIVKFAKNNNIKIIISTVAYNRMIPPFKQKDDSYSSCSKLIKASKFKKALACLNKALDADLQPFRASETSNKIIKMLAKNYKVQLIDTDKKIVNMAANGIPGNTFFYDHCHLHPNNTLQNIFYQAIKESGLLSKK
jgi:lysophospholipase L1-like esterase